MDFEEYAMEQNSTENQAEVSQETLWYLNNYIMLRDYLDRTIARIAARCVRSGNIAMEEYPFYGYILDVLEEICDTGDFVLTHPELYPYVEKKIKGGLAGLKKDLQEYKLELKSNATPEMIKDDKGELDRMKKALGITEDDTAFDPTAGAGMSMNDVVDKILKENTGSGLNQLDDLPAPEIKSFEEHEKEMAKARQQQKVQAQIEAAKAPQSKPQGQS